MSGPGTAQSDPRRIGVVGLALTVAGAVLVLLAITTIAWYADSSSGTDSIGRITFSTLHQATSGTGIPALSKAYFGWLAWVLLLLVILLGLAANIPSPGSNALRVVGLVVGLVGAVITYEALAKLHELGGNGSVFSHAAAGLYLALAGFVVAGVGSAIGPQR